MAVLVRRGLSLRAMAVLALLAAVYTVGVTPAAAPGHPEDAVVYVDQAEAIQGLEVPSGRYPPGFASVLAGGHLLGLDYLEVAKLVAVAMVGAAWLCAQRLGGDRAALIAGLLCVASPFATASGRWVMSDALGVTVALGALLAVTARRPMFAAAATAAGVLVRLMSGIGVLALVPLGRRSVVVAAAGAVVLFGGFQWAASGSPFTTGYDAEEASWAPEYVLATSTPADGPFFVDGTPAVASNGALDGRSDQPHFLRYALVLLGLDYVFMPPLVSLAGLWALWRRRQTDPARFVMWWLGCTLAILLPYFAQAPRLLAPAGMMLLVYSAVGISDALEAGSAFSSDEAEDADAELVAKA